MRTRWTLRLAALLAPLIPAGGAAGPMVVPAAAPAPAVQIEDATLAQLGFSTGGGHPSEPAGDWMAAQRADAEGLISHDAYARALAQARAVGELTRRTAPEIADLDWELMGPQNIGGRIAELAVDPTELPVLVGPGGARVGHAIYAATASGGVWRSTDSGVTWQYRWRADVTQAMGAIAVTVDGTIFAGTGELNPGGGSVVWGGTGIYRSKDDGATWQPVGLPTSGAIGRIVAHPTDPKIVYVAAGGNLFVPGGERGLYRTTDGGDTWERILAGDNDRTGAADVAVDPANPSNILVGMWDHIRLPTHRLYAGVGSGVYRSTNGGASFARMTLPAAPAASQVGRVGVAFSRSNPNRAYAILANNPAGSAIGLWRSNDGGATWAKASGGGTGLSQSSYGWWFGKIWVDPRAADRLFVAGLELSESVDGGQTFFPHGNTTAGVVTGANQAFPHADQHAMVWDPTVPSRVYLGNDGGIYVSEANASVGTWRPAALQGWTQHYSVGVSEQNPGRVVSGLQDNLCMRNYAAGSAGNPLTWHKYGLCGDGLQTLVNPLNENIIYGCMQYGANCSRTLEDGTAFEFLGAFSGRAGWWVPIVFDPMDPAVMYAGTNFVNKSTDGGLSWNTISPDLSTNPPQLDPNAGYRIYGTITTIAVSKSSPQVIHAGTDDAQMWRTEDGGTSWSKLEDHDDGDEDLTDDDQLPDRWITSVAIDPQNPQVVYATYSGFRNGSDTPHVFRSLDGGFIWDDISGNLPLAPVNKLIQAGSRLVVGTDVGVFLSEDAGATWLRVGSNLPAVPVLDLRYHASTRILTVSTFGHGIQRVTLP